MFSKLINCFEQNGFAMGLVLLLWIIIYDEKAIERVRRKPMIKKILYVTIILFYISIILPVMLPLGN
ncbi:hypothetical protein FACS1894102_4220 [Spirochaetia bacterium]|nr:hypothetical protein FACS1894102_4220 [Spirochaetia bacterium]